MNLDKSYEFFQPESVKETIHIIGCGSVGSTVAELLARYGLTNIKLYDFDYVEERNIANQMFDFKDVNTPKVVALANHLIKINPEIGDTIKIYEKGYTNQKLAGYVFLCVDNIELRKKIVEENFNNPFIKAMFDFRTRLTDAQHYAAAWDDYNQKMALLNSMDFTHAEASEETPVSACRVTLSVAPTIRVICSLGVNNFINYVKTKTNKKIILCNPFEFTIDAF